MASLFRRMLPSTAAGGRSAPRSSIGINTAVRRTAIITRASTTASSAGMRVRHKSCAIVGLPNIGKSTLFNALTKTQQAQAANYPFCTIEPNTATVAIVDPRLRALALLAKSQKVIEAQLTIVDVAGLVKGASGGAGLGNKFLGNIRECNVILQTVRCFEDTDVVHVDTTVDPIRDIEVFETELLLSDLQVIEKRLETYKKKTKHGDGAGAAGGGPDPKQYGIVLEQSLAALNAGTPLSAVGWTSAQWPVVHQLGALTSKPMAYLCNVDEASAATGNALYERVVKHVQAMNAKLPTADAAAAAASGGTNRHRPVMKVCGTLEAEAAASFAADEKAQSEYLEMAGLKVTGLQQVITVCSQLLGEHQYYTLGPQEARAWTISRGANAVDAAAKIHSDIAAGFVRAEVIKPADYEKFVGDESAIRAAGKVSQELKEYIVCDGDIMNFKHQKVAGSAKKK